MSTLGDLFYQTRYLLAERQAKVKQLKQPDIKLAQERAARAD